MVIKKKKNKYQLKIQKGYVRITDLGIAKKLKPENSEETSGTPGYMAPEVMCR